MIAVFSLGESIEVSPVEPMMRTAHVPWSSWNLSNVRNAPKSIEPSLLNGVISATNEPSILILAMAMLRGKDVRDSGCRLESEELVGLEEEAEHEAALRCARHVLAPLRPPDVLAGGHLALVVDEAALEHPALLELDVLVHRQLRARREARQRRHDSGLGILYQDLDVDALVRRRPPRQGVDVDVTRRKRGERCVLFFHSRCAKRHLVLPSEVLPQPPESRVQVGDEIVHVLEP